MAWEVLEKAKTDTILPALIMICDELAEFVDNEVDYETRKKVDQFQGNIESIARLGRASHVHLILATQSASPGIFPSSLKNNISQRFICGRVTPSISHMAIDSEAGASISTLKGVGLAYSKGEESFYRGWYTPLSQVLKLGTLKDGYDSKTGLQDEDSDVFDMSPVEDYDESGKTPGVKEDNEAREKDEGFYPVEDFEYEKPDANDFEDAKNFKKIEDEEKLLSEEILKKQKERAALKAAAQKEHEARRRKNSSTSVSPINLTAEKKDRGRKPERREGIGSKTGLGAPRSVDLTSGNTLPENPSPPSQNRSQRLDKKDSSETRSEERLSRFKKLKKISKADSSEG